MYKTMLIQNALADATQSGELAAQLIMGKSYLVRHAFENKDLNALWLNLRSRLLHNPFDAAALLDMSVILLILGKKTESMQAQGAALELCKIYRLQKGHNSGLRILVFMAPGDFMSNTPFEFLLDESDFNVIQFYVDENTTDLFPIPDHDLALMAISESASNSRILANVAKLLRNWHRPIINNQPQKISQLTRDGVVEQFCAASHVFAPPTIRASRTEIINRGYGIFDAVVEGENRISLIRPVDSHAGIGLQMICNSRELSNYVNQNNNEQFYLSQFVDYRSNDGLFRKYRIAFIGGKPFPSHMAISSHWMVHYLNADMASHELRRKEEERWFSSFRDFEETYAHSLSEICNIISLDYFVIDCAIQPDGRLLIFEVDVGAIVHDMDPGDLYPYKKMAMRRLFSAFESFLEQTASDQSAQSNRKIGHTPAFLLN
jgi:hypothetical protein